MFSFTGSTKKAKNVNLGGRKNETSSFGSKELHSRAIAERQKRERERLQSESILKIQRFLKLIPLKRQFCSHQRNLSDEKFNEYCLHVESTPKSQIKHNGLSDNYVQHDSKTSVTGRALFELYEHNIDLLESLRALTMVYDGSQEDLKRLARSLTGINSLVGSLAIICKNDKNKGRDLAFTGSDNSTNEGANITNRSTIINSVQWMITVLISFLRKILAVTEFALPFSGLDITFDNKLEKDQAKVSISAKGITKITAEYKLLYDNVLERSLENELILLLYRLLVPDGIFPWIKFRITSSLMSEGLYYQYIGSILSILSGEPRKSLEGTDTKDHSLKLQSDCAQLAACPFLILKSIEPDLLTILTEKYSSIKVSKATSFGLEQAYVHHFVSFILLKIPRLAYKCGAPKHDGINALAGNTIPWKAVLIELAATQKLCNPASDNPSRSPMPKNMAQSSKNFDFSENCSINTAVSFITNVSSFILPRIVNEQLKPSSITGHPPKNSNTESAASTYLDLFLDTAFVWVALLPPYIFNIFENQNQEQNTPGSLHVSPNKLASKNSLLSPTYASAISTYFSNEMLQIIIKNISASDINIFSKVHSSTASKSLEYLSWILRLLGKKVRNQVMEYLVQSFGDLANTLWISIVSNEQVLLKLTSESSPWDLIKSNEVWSFDFISGTSNPSDVIGKENINWSCLWVILDLIFGIFEKQLLSLSNREFLTRIGFTQSQGAGPKTNNYKKHRKQGKVPIITPIWSSTGEGVVLLGKIARNVGLAICWQGLDKDPSVDLVEKSNHEIKSHIFANWWRYMLNISIKISHNLFLKDELYNFTESTSVWQLSSTHLFLGNYGDKIVEDSRFLKALKDIEAKSSLELDILGHFGLDLNHSELTNEPSSSSDSESDSDHSDSDENYNSVRIPYIKSKLTSSGASRVRRMNLNRQDSLQSLISVLLKMPFVIPFKERVSLFNALVRKDLQKLRSRIDSNSTVALRAMSFEFGGFRNLDTSAFLTIRRNNVFMDGFNSLYPLLKGQALVKQQVDGYNRSHQMYSPYRNLHSSRQSLYSDEDYDVFSDLGNDSDIGSSGIFSSDFLTRVSNQNNRARISGTFRNRQIRNTGPQSSLSRNPNIMSDARAQRLTSYFVQDQYFEEDPASSQQDPGSPRSSQYNHNNPHTHNNTNTQAIQNQQISNGGMYAHPNSFYSPIVDLISPSDAFKMGFRISFIDSYGLSESGIDGGGVFREFIQSLESLSFGEVSQGVFLFETTKSEPHSLYPKPIPELVVHSSTSKSAEAIKKIKLLEFAGAIIAKSLYDGRLISAPFEFSSFFLNRWLGLPFGLNEIEQFDFQIYNSLDSLRTFDTLIHQKNELTPTKASHRISKSAPEDDPFYSIFGLDFTVNMVYDDKKMATFKLPGPINVDEGVQSETSLFNHDYTNNKNFYLTSGASHNDSDIPIVTSSNKLQYLNSAVDFYLNDKSVSIPQLALMKGIFDITPCSWYRMLFCSPSELNHFISNGSLFNSTIDIQDWKRHTVYTGSFLELKANHPCIILFWDIVENSLVENERRSLLKFITGSEVLPQVGFRGLDPLFCIQGVENSLKLSYDQTSRRENEFDLSENSGYNFSNLRVSSESHRAHSSTARANNDDQFASISKNNNLSANEDVEMLPTEEKELRFGRFPSASTCANLLKLPVYTTRAALKQKLLTALVSTSGFDLS